jgi:hypothetical protein
MEIGEHKICAVKRDIGVALHAYDENSGRTRRVHTGGAVLDCDAVVGVKAKRACRG